MRWTHQLESKLAFTIAVLAQTCAMLTPMGAVGGERALGWTILESIRDNLTHPEALPLIIDVFFVGANLLWLISPFLTRVYGQSKAVLVLAVNLSFFTAIAMGLLFLLYRVLEVPFPSLALLLASVAHLIGMFRIRKEGPDEQDFLH